MVVTFVKVMDVFSLEFIMVVEPSEGSVVTYIFVAFTVAAVDRRDH